MANAEAELAQVEAALTFSPSRQSQEDAADNKRAQADLLEAHRLCKSTTALARVFTKASEPCQPPHSVHIHLSGFEKSEIDMLVSVCGETKPKWHIVHWAPPGPTDPQQSPTGSICSVLKNSRSGKARLRIQLHPDGCWIRTPPVPDDRMRNYAVAPKKTLDEWLWTKKDGKATPTASSKLTRKNKLRLALRIARSLLCLLGSPLLQGPLKSQSILVTEIADESSNEGLEIRPYIPGGLTGCLEREESEQSGSGKLFMLHLGLLLWELFVGEKVTITDEDKEEDEDEDEDEDETKSLFNALGRKEYSSRQSSFIDISCLDLIANCLNLYEQASTIDAAFRAKLYWGIVKPLIMSFEDYTPSKEKLATALESRPAPPPLPPILSSDRRQARSVLTRGMPSIASPNRVDEQHVGRHVRPEKCVLFDADDQTYQKRFVSLLVYMFGVLTVI